MDTLLVASAKAGSTETQAVDATRAVLARAGAVEVAETRSVDDLDAVLDRLDGRRLVVAGGDGSVHLLVDRLWRRAGGAKGSGPVSVTGSPVGIVPLGTGNDLARSLGIPLEPGPAAQVALDAGPRPLDLVRDDEGGIVVNAVHLGVGAAAAERAGRLKPRLGPLAYPLGAVAAGLRSTGWRMRVDVDDTVLSDGRHRLLMLGIGNARGIGGGTPLLPDARPDDGALDVVAVSATGPFARVGFGAALTKGTHVRRDDVRTARGRAVSVRAEGVEVNADGELGDVVTRRSWWVEPAVWAVYAPPDGVRASGG